MFLNETIHPKAGELFNKLLTCLDRQEHGDPDYYQPLAEWWREQGLTNEKAADLYAQIEEAFAAKPIHSVPCGAATSMLSRALWLSDRRYVQ